MSDSSRNEIAGILREARAIGLGVETNRKLDDAISVFETNSNTERKTMSNENNQAAPDGIYNKLDQVVNEVVEVDLLADAAEDPSMPIRNLAGHLVTCNYGDWADFSKCKCAEGLVGMPEKQTAFVVAPMPLRDLLASSIQVSDELAHELAVAIRQTIKQGQKIETVGEVLGVSNELPLTVIELADARAKIRYLEADAMISWRAISLRLNAEANAKAKSGAKIEAEPPRIVVPGTPNG